MDNAPTTVSVPNPPGAGQVPSGTWRPATWANLRASDFLLALLITSLGVADAVRHGGSPVLSAGLLAFVGGACLIWRHIAPMAVLLISGACFCGFQFADYPHRALPFAVLIAVYTFAVKSGALITAVAAGILVGSSMVSETTRTGWPPPDVDDVVLAYLLSFGAACALGYAVQLSRARNELLEEQAKRLTSEHSAHEQRALGLEQARIAREMHDVIAHQMSLVTALAAGAKRVYPKQPDLARDALDSIELAGREALTEMRLLLRVLRADSGDVGLLPQPSLEQLPALIAHTEAAGLPVRLEIQGQPRSLPAAVEMCAYRIVQEALTNTLKHAGPSRATVLVSYQPAMLELHVWDDGRGMSPSASAGNGLIGMYERASLLDGRLTVDAGPSGGVQISAWVPAHGGKS